jgi:hypothetical protein
VIEGVSNGAEMAIESWRSERHAEHSTAWLRLAGVSGGLALMMIAIRRNSRLANLIPDVTRLAANPAPLRLFAWLVISYGLADVIARFLPSFGQREALLQLCLGFLIVPFSAPLARALRRADHEIGGSDSSA